MRKPMNVAFQIALVLSIVALTLTGVSCNPEVEGPSKGTGSLSIGFAASSKTIEPSFELGRCAKYVIALKPVGSEVSMTFEVAGDSYTIDNLESGDYEIQASGCNQDGIRILESEAQKITIENKRTTNVTLRLDRYVSGNGKLSLSILIPAKDETVVAVAFSLLPLNDEVEVLDYIESTPSISADGRFSVYSLALELPAGDYIVKACPLESLSEEDDPKLVGVPHVESLHVFNGTLSESRIVWDARFFSMVEDPTFSVADGSCNDGTILRIQSSDPRASIYYTMDGSKPSTDSNMYLNPIVIDRCMTVKAIAVVDGFVPSNVVQATYTVKVQSPVFSIKDKSFIAFDELSISTATKDAVVVYTMDGTEPSWSNGVVYGGPFVLRSTVQIKAVALKDGLEPSDVVSATYYDENSPSPSFLFTVNERGAISIDASVSTDSIPDMLVLPSSLDGIEVSEIAAGGFAGLPELRGILIPDTVRKIGARAFKGSTGIESVNISKFVESLDESAFQGWTAEQSINDYSGLVKANTLKDCKARIYATVKTETQVVSGYTGMANLYGIYMTDNITTIADNAFSGCVNLEDFTMPSLVTTIGSLAFNGCTKIESITLPATLKSLAVDAFKGWTDEQSIVDEGSIALQTKFSGSFAKVYTRIPSYDSQNNPVTEIPANSGAGRNDIYGLVIPSTIETIGDNAFEGTSIESLVIPSSVRNMGLELFKGWTDDQKVSIEYGGYTAKVSADGSKTPFTGTGAVFDVTIANDVTSIVDDAFNGMKTLVSIDIPDSVTIIGMRSFKGTSLRSVSIGGNLRSIGDGAFKDCTSIESVELSDGIQTIGDNAFNGCTSLGDVKLPDSVLSIGEGVFSNCIALESVDLGSGVTSIPEKAFDNSPSLTSITAPNCMGGMDIEVVVPLGQYVVHDVRIDVKPTYAAIDGFSTKVSRDDSSITNDGWVFSYSIPDMLGLTYSIDVTLIDFEGNVVGTISRQERVISNNSTDVSIKVSFSDMEDRSLPKTAIEPNVGTILDGQTLTISCDDADAIYYTMDGTMPSPEMGKGVRYEGPFEIHSPVTIKAVAVKEGFSHSRSSATYKVQALAPTFNLDSDKKYPSTQYVELGTKTIGATIQYTTDGSDPAKNGTEYSSAIEVSKTTTIRAVAKKDGLVVSDEVKATFTLEIPSHEVVTPVERSVAIKMTMKSNSVLFTAVLTPASDEASYKWYFDGELVGEDATFILSNDVTVGCHIVEVVAKVDGISYSCEYMYQPNEERPSYRVDLNSQWVLDSLYQNPNSSLYEGVYKSNSNYHVASGSATMKVYVKGYSKFSIYVRSNAEGSYDYVKVFALDSTTTEKLSTKGRQNSSKGLDGYTIVEFSIPDDGKEHCITITYLKDGSQDSGEDRGFVLIPKSQI